MKNSSTSLAIIGLLCAAALTGVGCGKDAPPAIQQASQAQIDNTVKMREMYVKANGNYDSLTAEDKQAYIKLAGSEAAGQAQWATMNKNPVGGTPTPAGTDPRAAAMGGPGVPPSNP